MEPLIQNKENIPHAMAKLPFFPLLIEYLKTHMTEGLCLLQFHKCDNESCCQKKTNLQPPVPAPVISRDNK